MKVFIIVGLVVLSFCCQQTGKSPALNLEKDIVDFGRIKKDSVVKVYFDFKNTGSDTLMIINVSADCGCTEINYRKGVILPGQEDVIEVIYSPKSNNDSGIVSKNIAIRSNSEPPINVIKIKGEIVQ